MPIKTHLSVGFDGVFCLGNRYDLRILWRPCVAKSKLDCVVTPPALQAWG